MSTQHESHENDLSKIQSSCSKCTIEMQSVVTNLTNYINDNLKKSPSIQNEIKIKLQTLKSMISSLEAHLQISPSNDEEFNQLFAEVNDEKETNSNTNTTSSRVKCDNNHALNHMTNNDLKKEHSAYAGGYICDVCRQSKDASFSVWHCTPCGYDLCQDCYDKKSSTNSEEKESNDARGTNNTQCDQGHELKWGATGYRGNYRCDRCRKSVSDKSAYRCASCGYDLCKECYGNKGKGDTNIKCARGHPVKWGATGYRGNYRCDICHKSVNAKSAYRCASCGYDLCKECFDKQGGATCDKDHILKWENTGYKQTYGIDAFSCDICRKSVQSEFAHRCGICGYDLCQQCYDKKNGDDHDAHELKHSGGDSNVISCDNNHELTRVSHPELIGLHGYNYALGYICRICEGEYANVDAWHCKRCLYDICLTCYEQEYAKSNTGDIDVQSININKLLQVEIRCTEQHICKYAAKEEMIQINVGYASGFTCNLCRCVLAFSSTIQGAWQCSICSYDACRNCFQTMQCQSAVIEDKFAFKLMDCIQYNEYFAFSHIVNVLTHNSNNYDINHVVNKYNHTQSNLNVLVHAVQKGSLPIIKLLHTKYPQMDLNGSSSNGQTPIIQAAENDNVEMVQWLLSNGASPNSMNGNTETAMWHAANNGNVEIMRLLIEFRFDWNAFINKPSSAAGGGAFTVFHMCCLNGSIPCLEYIFSIEANYDQTIDVHRKAIKNQTALVLAVTTNMTSVVEFLFTKTRFLSAKNIVNEPKSGSNEAAVHISARWGNVAVLQLLNEHGADMLLANGNNLNALLIAACLNKPAAVQYLVDSKCIDANTVQKDNGFTPLNVCLDHANAFTVCKLLCGYDHVEILKHKRQGYDELDLCCLKGRVKCFQLLLTTLIKRNHITNWKAFEQSNILSSEKTQSLLLLAKYAKQAAMKLFLENLTKNALAHQNFGLLLAMCDTKSGTAAKKKIEIGERILSKNETIAKVLIAYLSNEENKASDIINKLNNVINKMIANKEPINDMLLFFANATDQAKLMRSLKSSITESLNGSNTRDYSWYKNCLLSSHIWSVEKQKKDELLLFDEMKVEVIDKELSKQQRFLSQQISNEIQTEQEAWNNIVTFPETNIALSGVMNQHFLQDFITAKQYMSNGCKVKYKQSELFTDLITGFDGQSAYDLDQYLNDLVITAHKINGEFQRQCRKLFTKQSLGCDCFFKPAPVKTKERSQIKATVDYHDKPWPTTSAILDFVRCGVTFKSAKDMMTGLVKAKSLIDVSKSSGCIKRVCRIKNMFKGVPLWGDDLTKYTYCDIKFNVVIEHNDASMIGEIQFLLSWMQEAKVLGHSLYGFVRNEEFVKELSTEWYENATEDDRRGELLNIVAIKDYKRLEKQLLFGDLKQIFGIKFIQNDTAYVLKDILIQNKWKKGLKLYQATLERFNKLNVCT